MVISESREVELIPVIEIGFKEVKEESIPTPKGNGYWLNSEEWETYYEQKIRINGYKNYERIRIGYPFYRVNQFTSKDDLLKIVQFHLGGEIEEERTSLEESCALFGGYVLKIDGQIIFTPQCCNLLSDIVAWQAIIQNDFKEDYIFYQGHPSPKVKREGEKLHFSFEVEWEDFIPPAINTIVGRNEMIEAVKRCQSELNKFGKVLDSLELIFNQKNIADILIYEKNSVL